MARLNKREIFLLTFLTLHFVGVGIWLPTHRDGDNSLWPGQAKVLEHKDNGPCRDIPLSNTDDYCAICAAAQNRASFKPVYFSSGQLQIVGRVELLAPITLSQQLHLDSFSRRGPPPSLLA